MSPKCNNALASVIIGDEPVRKTLLDKEKGCNQFHDTPGSICVQSVDSDLRIAYSHW